MTGILLVAQFILAILITIVVLLQKSSSIGLGSYSGSNESMFGAKGPNSFLTKATWTLAIIFVINTIALTYSYYEARTSSVTDRAAVPTAPESSAPAAPVAPGAPKSE